MINRKLFTEARDNHLSLNIAKMRTTILILPDTGECFDTIEKNFEHTKDTIDIASFREVELHLRVTQKTMARIET